MQTLFTSVISTAIAREGYDGHIVSRPIQFLWLSKMAAEFIVYLPFRFVFALLITNLVCAYIRQRPFQTGRWRNRYWLIFTQILFFPAVIAVAVLGGVNFVPPHEVNKLASLCASTLWWTSLILAVLWIWRMKGIRWTAVSLVALQQFLVLGAFITADMAISGSWL